MADGASLWLRRRPDEICGQFREFVGRLYLWHMADAGEEMMASVWKKPTRCLEVACGQDAIAFAPHDKSGTRMLGCFRNQFVSPFGSDATAGAQ